MYRIKFLGQGIGQIYDDQQFSKLWSTGITPIKFVTYEGKPLVAPAFRDNLDVHWRDGVQQLHKTGWGR